MEHTRYLKLIASRGGKRVTPRKLASLKRARRAWSRLARERREKSAENKA